MTIPPLAFDKKSLRKIMREMVRGLEGDSAKANDALHHWLLGQPMLKTIAVFSPLPGEVDLTNLTKSHPEQNWVYPKVLGEELTFHRGTNLLPGAFGILEPVEGTAEVPIKEIDAFICPGLAFDLSGGRLGRGRGFYDRMLAGARKDALKIGVCFPEQIVPNTFPEAHDQKMDVVIS
ncbi:MAG: 5-formyltetrahydrofolate cyclo-ligase [Akkermansiaceae bacterium]|nr:5-formyltetrahydrofolate cyclo-ligase [Akkermansiaceae bacterium]